MDLELNELENIIDFIIPDNEINTNATEIMESCLLLIEEYITENPTAISEPDFEEILIDELIDLMTLQMSQEMYLTDAEIDDLTEIIEYSVDYYFDFISPPRSYSDSIILYEQSETYKKQIEQQIEYLEAIPQPVQRTKEWYEFRHNLITASNAYKAFENQTIQNQLIYEKCLPIVVISDTGPRPESKQVNITTTLHWGQKYEPLSVLFYEHTYHTKVSDFGCIPHPIHKFIGASPDGINTDPSSDRYGRMLEIKNIVNREIDGIPKKEYWIQMQMQMETCHLSECDFLETKFEEYLNEEEYLLDGSFIETEKNKRKGIIMYFANNEGNPKYVYCPLHIQTLEEFAEWEENMMKTKEEEGLTWISNIYWRLEFVSCVLVPRNKNWFESNIVELQSVWNTILEEREKDYSHRGPAKRAVKQVTQEDEIGSGGGCLIVLDKIFTKSDS